MSGHPESAFTSFTIHGRAIAPGVACGPLRRNRTELEPAEVAGAVLLAERAVPDDIGRILASAGTVTLSGALLSHVSLLSREFGKPSVSLAGITPARLSEQAENGLLLLQDIDGASSPAALDEGDIVFLDGSVGALSVPGGFDREARRQIRIVHAPLAAFAKLPADDSVLRALLDVVTTKPALAFLLDAALIYRMVPPGAPARRLLEALSTTTSRATFTTMIEALRERVLEAAAERCDRTRFALESAEDLEDLKRGLGTLEHGLERDLRLLEDLGGDPDRLESRLEPVLAVASTRRAEMETALQSDLARALALPDDVLRSKLGGFFRLLRRARAANLGPDDIAKLHRRLARQFAEERARAGAQLVLPLTGIARHERALVGGKAQSLIELGAALPEGCRTPRGFVVTSAAYRLHLLGETGEKLRVAADEPNENAVSRMARAAILSGDLPDEVREAIVTAFEASTFTRCAVRSSATIEDGALGSFAGLFDTYLGVAGPPELVDRIRWAWASLWNARALAAFKSMGLSALRAAQAVLVQEMIETRAAGVLFSRDPAGRPDTMLINAAWGLGEGIAQGEVAGDLFWVRRSSGELIDFETGRAERRIELAPKGMGTVEVPLSEEERGRACLTPAELGRIATLARALEEITGRAQNVEFGIDHDGGLVVLQMRRIVPRRME